ncbi:MAG: tRNA (N6-threonylcarbamoyladenosine(37)-N6)-methyltransferase TrmO [Proteobacteria bacterium]|nr:tRNA (N6-threonylcarbamoyladenosine(37)-N6)-methyltransferase TrmO [Pseudomonadota bacterium]MBU1640408.1 tRNA (N6-threonylcarbamoyladenosine(37)-N6)-methyltransferase TrmO [Pseudomonadota bacterium]
MEPIAIIRSCFTDKFGIPRQPGLVPASTARLEMLPPYSRPEAVEGLAEFSHIWVFFLFHQAVARGWKPTVRPPRLGGNKRVGVFASRSPQRPNFIGSSVVRLEKISVNNKIVTIHVSGVDFLDMTPVLDIKPYVPYSDSVPNASCGYAHEPTPSFDIVFTPEVLEFCLQYKTETKQDLKELISQILAQDPRPAYHDEDNREYGMSLWDLNIRFAFHKGTIVINTITHQ